MKTVGHQKLHTAYSIESGKILQSYWLTLPRQLRYSVLCFVGDGNVVLCTNTTLGRKMCGLYFKLLF